MYLKMTHTSIFEILLIPKNDNCNKHKQKSKLVSFKLYNFIKVNVENDLRELQQNRVLTFELCTF